MGYETRYDLKVIGDYAHEDLVKVLEDYGIIGYALDRCFESYGGVKWYEHEENMLEISKLFPNLEFILEGDGEESPDYWRKKFKNGEMSKATGYIAYGDYE